MLTMRQRVGFIVAAVLVVVALIVFSWFFLSRKESAIPTSITTTTPIGTSPAVREVRTQVEVVAQELPLAEQNELVARQLARDFVERFRSFSNQNENVHILSVLPFVTESMEGYVRRQVSDDTIAYEGMTTTVLNTKVESYTELAASIEVSVQERRFSSSTESVVYRTGTVAMKKINGSWYVDGLFWGAEDIQ